MTAKKTAAPKVEDFAAMPIAVPDAVREMAEKSLEQAKDMYSKVKVAAEEATDMMEDTVSTTSKGVADMNLKALDMAKDNMNASFDFAKSLFGVKTMSDAVELQTGFARKQYEANVAQAKELSEIANKVATESVKPVTEGVQKAMKDLKVAV
ncbi:MAG: phasin [Pseudomonadota bacterium]